MPYCTPTDIETLIPGQELAELTTEWGNIPDAAVIAEIISLADAEIDAYVSRRYDIPFAPIPDMLRSLSMDMAIYHLYSRRSAVPAIRQTKYGEAIRFLQNVAAGKANIFGPGGAGVSTKSFAAAEIVSSIRIFSRESWGNY